MEVAGELSQQMVNMDVQRMLLVAYRQIGEPDSICWMCSTHITDDMCGGEGMRREELIEYQYKAAWRCGQWEEGTSLVTPTACGGYHQTMHSWLTALRDGETELLNSFIAEAR